jgi:DNA-binding MarR family transcriptional regulator
VLTSQTSAEATAFLHILRVDATLRRELEARLLAALGLTVKDYEVLITLARAELGSLRRVDLATQVLLSPSGVTRLLDGLERLGLVEKGVCTSDARVTYAVITEAGRRTAAKAEAQYDAVLRELIGGSLTPAQLETLVDLLGRLPGAGGGGYCPLDPDGGR